MDEYYNADDQAQAVKIWLKKYGISILIGLALGIALFYVLQSFMAKKVVASEKAATAYVLLLNAAAIPNNPQIAVMADDMVKQYPKTPYASLAQFFAAQVAVNTAQYDTADSRLQWIVYHGKPDSFRQIARIRLARVLLQQQKMDEAETVLKRIDDKTYMPLIEMVQGDIALAQKHPDQAKKEYESALKGAEPFPGLVNVLQMKLSDPNLVQN